MTSVIAHRGARRLARENTIEAFHTAVRVGADGIELDVRRTVDGALVVHHDARLADGRAIVESSSRDLPGYVPTLWDALDACSGAFVNIEIKNQIGEPDFDSHDAVADAVVELLRAREEPLVSWLISSFNRSTIDRCRAVEPQIATAWLTANIVTDDDIASVAESGHQALHPLVVTVDHGLIDRCHAAGLRLNTWTCNDTARAVELDSWGIDGICTDVPDVIRAALTKGLGGAQKT